MDGKEVYQAFLHELKHEHTTSITPEEFNYHIWRSEIEYVKTRYWAYDQHQKPIDDLAILNFETNGIAGMPDPLTNQGQNIAGKEHFDLPDDLLILINVAIIAKVFGSPCLSDGELSDPTAARYLSGDREKTVHHSYYSEPSYEYPTLYYKIRNNKILPVIGKSIAQECIITYLKYPQRIEVDENTGESKTGSPFKDMQTLEIVRMGVLSYLETIESHRSQTMAQIESRKFEQYPPPYFINQQ